jgi:hypothetical protein
MKYQFLEEIEDTALSIIEGKIRVRFIDQVNSFNPDSVVTEPAFTLQLFLANKNNNNDATYNVLEIENNSWKNNLTKSTFNKLLAVVEDLTGISIHELTKGQIDYVEIAKDDQL